MATSKKTAKVSKKNGKNGKASAASKKSVASMKLSPATKISFLKARNGTGPKTDVLALVPRKGTITFGKLKAKAEAEELNVAKLPKWLTTMAKNGRVELHA